MKTLLKSFLVLGLLATVAPRSAFADAAPAIPTSDFSLVYAFSETNPTDATSLFTFSYTLPIDVSGATTVSASLGISLTDGSNDGVQLTQNLNDFFQTVTLDSTDANVSLGTFPITGTSGGTQTFTYQTGPVTGPTGTFTTLTITDSFALSAGDTVSVSGRADVFPASGGVSVPEPTTTAFLGLGLLGLVVALARSRRLVKA